MPTTLLASQHVQTFSDRLAPYPVRVEVLSRFLTPGQARQVVKGVGSGEVDLVIGTHRLLSEDVKFKDLGLLIIDEEQRFGVTHKEAIKRLATNVDVLTLTATPIPRTLEMSLVGIRDLSLLNTPPADRQPILTYVGEHDERAVGEAIRRELLREGQVFYVHNRVQDIDRVADRLRELVPEARIVVAHGQMDEGTLEEVVLDFWEGRYDVLVCTTIIESGIDMPTVNTLVVDRADLLGLGQLHQLRGRVGRAGSRAYAYLFFPPDRELTEESYERLKTIAEATELGSGFKIAMRDLEIRGAGNLLGTGQSGHVAAVGYDLYCQMVTEAVAELKGEQVRPPAEVKLDLPVDAHLPPDYVAKEDLRLEAYRRLAAVTSTAEVDDIRIEWVDRYGPVPEPAAALLAVGRLRAECHRSGVREVVVAKAPAFSSSSSSSGGSGGLGGAPLVARLRPLPLRVSQQMRLQRLYKGAVYKEDMAQAQVPLPRTTTPAGAADAVVELAPRYRPRFADRGGAGRPGRAHSGTRAERSGMRRLVIPLVALVALGASACGGWRQDDAASVNGVDIESARLEADTRALLDQPAVAGVFLGVGAVPTAAAGDSGEGAPEGRLPTAALEQPAEPAGHRGARRSRAGGPGPGRDRGRRGRGRAGHPRRAGRLPAGIRRGGQPGRSGRRPRGRVRGPARGTAGPAGAPERGRGPSPPGARRRSAGRLPRGRRGLVPGESG